MTGLRFVVMKTRDVREAPATAGQWRWHHAALRRLEAALARVHPERHAATPATPVAHPPNRIDVYPSDPEFREWLTKLARDESEHAEVREALARSQAGTYAICEKTGQPIAPERLRAVPWARSA